MVTKLRKDKLGSKSRKDSKIKVITNWQHTEEVPLAFKRLMALLLHQKIEPKAKEGGKR